MGEYKIAIKIAGELDSSFNAAISGAQAGIRALGGMSTVGAAAKGIGKGIMASAAIAGKALGVTTTALVGVGAASVKAGSTFESAMASLGATAGVDKTSAAFSQMEQAALDMGRTTSKTASECAGALEYMALAGWNTQDSVAALPSIVHASEAFGSDLKLTSDLVTDSMSAMGLSIDELPGYLDVAARAQNSSNMTAKEMMEAYIGVGGVMRGLGVPINESATALGMLANAGIKGSEAGTALNAIMTNLTTGTGQAGDMMEKLGVSAFDSNGNFIGLEATLQNLNTALQDLTPEERNAALAAIGGKHHVDALNALMAGLNDTTEDGVSKWDDLTNKLNDAEGALEKMRNTKMDTLAGDFKTLTSAAEYAGIQIFKAAQKGEGGLRGLVQYGTTQINRLSDALKEGGFGAMAQELGNVVSDSLEVLTSSLPEITAAAGELYGGLLKGIQDNAGSIGNSIAQLASAGIQGFMAWYSDFWSTGLMLAESFLQGFETEIPNLFTSLGNALGKLGTTAGNTIPGIIEAGAGIVKQLMQGVTQGAPAFVSGLTDLISTAASGFAKEFPALRAASAEMFASLVSSIAENIPQLLQSGMDIAQSLADGFVQELPIFLEQAPQMMMDFVQGLSQSLPQLASQAAQIVTTLIQGIITNLPQLVSCGAQLIAAIGTGLLAAGASLIEGFDQIIAGAVEAFQNADWGQIWDGIVQGLQTAVDFIMEMWGNLPEWFTGIFEGLGDMIGEVVGDIASWAVTGWNAIVGAIGNAKDAVVGW